MISDPWWQHPYQHIEAYCISSYNHLMYCMFSEDSCSHLLLHNGGIPHDCLWKVYAIVVEAFEILC